MELLENKLDEELKRTFGYSSFREGQKEIIRDVMSGQDVLGILPTGTGKSLCYQLPATMMNGSVLIVSPLISLMIDQVKQLKKQGFKRAVAINSFLDFQQKQDVFKKLHQYKIIYCSPEMLQNETFVSFLKNSIEISLFVIDEAHCISQWGHEFRPDYLKLDRILNTLNQPTVLALSATAPINVQNDIIEQIDRPNMKKHIYPMDRENIALAVEHVENMNEKLERIKSVLTSHPVPSMIYFTSRQWTEKAAFELSQSLPDLRIAYYHGGMDQTDRLLIQQQFMNNQLDIICCTSAFGMGVNKPNIRLVIHAHIPSQIESFLQEIGRAGRDGNQSVSLTLYSKGDAEIPRRLYESELPDKGVLNRVKAFLNKEEVHHNILPGDEEIQHQLEISEIQWRFIKYQLENHGMIKGNKIYLNSHQDKVFMDIMTFIEERRSLKESRLRQLVNWIHQDTCRRSSLYKSFQSTLKDPNEFCCDLCDFYFHDWKVDKLEPIREWSTWDKELKKIFLQGALHELEEPS